MKTIKIDEELYQYIASQTTTIGEEASDILRRLLGFAPVSEAQAEEKPEPQAVTVEAETEEENVETAAVCSKSLFDVLNKEELAMQKGAVGRFLHILAMLYRVHGKAFGCILDIRGRNRLYFAETEQELLVNGSSTNPKQVPGSHFWVITNSNTTKKKSMLTDVAYALGYSSADAERIRESL